MMQQTLQGTHQNTSLHQNILLHNDDTKYERKKEHDFIEMFLVQCWKIFESYILNQYKHCK